MKRPAKGGPAAEGHHSRERGAIDLSAADEAILRTITDRTRSGVCAVERAGRFTYVNEPVAQSLGFPADAFLGRNFLEFIHEEDRDRVRDNFERVLAGEEVPPYELAYHPAAGGPMWVEVDTAQLG